MDQSDQQAPTSSNPQTVVVVLAAQKSVGLAFILAFLFGPLGLLYASVVGGVVMFVLSVVIGLLTVGLGLLVVWPVCVIWAVVAANGANKKAAMPNPVSDPGVPVSDAGSIRSSRAGQEHLQQSPSTPAASTVGGIDNLFHGNKLPLLIGGAVVFVAMVGVMAYLAGKSTRENDQAPIANQVGIQPQETPGGDAGPAAVAASSAMNGNEETAADAVRSDVAPAFAFTALTAAYDRTCGFANAESAYCWGHNYYGEVGDGSTIDRASPVPIKGEIVFTAIIPGGSHTCGLTKAGTAYCWGYNDNGALGDGTLTSHLTPVPVQGGLDFTTLTAGRLHTCGLTSTGAAYCWGFNELGGLGDATTLKRLTPTAVQGGLVFAALAAGEFHTCGLARTGTTYCWGHNEYDQLGDGSTTNRTTPTTVHTALRFTALTAGLRHTCGLAKDGAAYCWGQNDDGELGDGTKINRSSPVAVKGSLSFVSISAGGGHTCGLMKTGSAYCWGNNKYGQLGDGTTSGSDVPVLVQGSLPFATLSAAIYYSCAWTSSGTAYCWGANNQGELGNGTWTDRKTPAQVTHASAADARLATEHFAREAISDMTFDLQVLATSEESYFSKNATYTTSLADLSYNTFRGTTVSVLSATSQAWSASASSSATKGTCTLSGGRGLNGVPLCN